MNNISGFNRFLRENDSSIRRNIQKRTHERGQTMDTFRTDNTEGYSAIELDALNAEWRGYIKKHNLEPYTEEYSFQEKAFCDEVSRR